MISWTVYFGSAWGEKEKEMLDYRRANFELMRGVRVVSWDEAAGW